MPGPTRRVLLIMQTHYRLKLEICLTNNFRKNTCSLRRRRRRRRIRVCEHIYPESKKTMENVNVNHRTQLCHYSNRKSKIAKLKSLCSSYRRRQNDRKISFVQMSRKRGFTGARESKNSKTPSPVHTANIHPVPATCTYHFVAWQTLNQRAHMQLRFEWHFYAFLDRQKTEIDGKIVQINFFQRDGNPGESKN